MESKDYSYSFSPELEQEWSWSERYPAQPEILRYLNHVADRFDLWPHIQLNTRVTGATWDAEHGLMERDDLGRRHGDGALLRLGGRLPVGVPGAGPAGTRHVRGPLVPHRALAARRRRLQRPAGRADRHRVHRDPGRARDRGGRRAAVRVPADRELRGAEPEPAVGGVRGARVQVPVREYRAEARESFSGCPSPGRGGRCCPSRHRTCSGCSRSGGRPAAACRSSAPTPTCSSRRRPTTSWPSSCGTGSGRRSTTRRSPRCSARAATRSGPSGCARATTTTRCSTGRTCPWSTSGPRRSSRYTREA